MTTTSFLQHFAGGCRCGALRVDLALPSGIALPAPRACDCGFCTRHGAAWLSDPAGRLTIEEAQPGALVAARQGSGSAGFQACARCGDLVAVVFADGDTRHAAANARCLRDGAAFGEPVVVSPRQLAPAERQARWRTLWMHDVRIVRLPMG
ncbi:aldehyde-activating protein [Coralloluteibacterium thermophilus]|uniref:Aldehyde-activating protein n=1 Tax=Coralloluteibacterium thermophilum TaxID=2707049 RepID=A0ABV9NKU9_9GAMM